MDVETGEAVDGRRAEEVLAHPGRTAGRDAAAAFDAAVELENLLGKLVFHALFFGAGIERLVLRVNPRFDLAAHFTEPHARIHGQVAKQLEDRQGMQDDIDRADPRVWVWQARPGRPLMTMPQEPQTPARQQKSNWRPSGPAARG